MKTQKMKILIPMMAIVVAITSSAFSVANTLPSDENLTMINGYTANDIPGQPCNVVRVDCSDTGAFLCTNGGKQVYKIASGTTCFSQLKRNN